MSTVIAFMFDNINILYSFISNNSEVLGILIAFLTFISTIITLIVMVKLAKTISNSTEQFINAKNIDDLFCKKLDVPIPVEKEDGTEIELSNLKDLFNYTNDGYVTFMKQYQMNIGSYWFAIITFFQLLKNAKTGTYKPRKDKFIDILMHLPARAVFSNSCDVLDIKSNVSLEKYMKRANGLVEAQLDGYKIKIPADETGNFFEFYFTQLYRADFSGNKCEEILFLYTEWLGGTMHMTNLRGIRFGKKHWYSIGKRWFVFDTNKITPDLYAMLSL